MSDDITHKEILDAVNAFSTSMDQNFQNLKGEVGDLKEEFKDLKGEVGDLKGDVGNLKGDVAGLKGDVQNLQEEVGIIKSTMVTKDYLDEKLTDLRGDLVVLVRKEDTKLNTLVNVLHTKRVLDDRDVGHIQAMEPFSR